MSISERWPFKAAASTTGINGTDITCARTTTGTIRNATGYLEDVAINTPRLDYDANGACKGLLIEGDMVQLADVDQESLVTGWNHGFGNWTADAATDPYGNATSADKLASGPSGNLSIWSTPNLQASQIHTLSVFIKNDDTNVGTQPWLNLAPNSYTGITGGMWFNPATGEVGTATWSSNISSGSETFANGWYRVWFSWTHNTDVSGNIYVRVVDGDGSAVDTGLTDDDGFFFWGVQIEYSNIAHPTSYFNGVLRDGDDITVTDVSAFEADWLTFPCSWYTEFTQLGLNNSIYLGHVMNGATPAIDLGYEVFDDLRVRYSAATGGTVTSVGTIQENETVNRAATSANLNDLSMSFNGEAVVQDATVSQETPTTVSSIVLGKFYGGGQYLNGYIRDLIFYYGEDIDDATLVTMSTNGVDYSTAFGGTIVGDGGVMWPPRANDPRWTQLISDSGITASGNFMDDVKKALIALSGASNGSLDDLWKKTLAANSITDISEPYLY